MPLRALGKGIYETVFSHIGDGVVVTDQSATIVDWSPGAEQLFGYTKEEALGRSPDFIFDTHHPGLPDQVISVLHEEGSWRGELSFRRRDGSLRWCDSLVVLVRDDEGKGLLTVGVNRDITARREAEASASMSAAILDNSREIIHLIRTDNASFVYVNPAFERVFGYAASEVLGRHVELINAPGDLDPAEVAAEIIGELQAKGQWSGEVRNITKDGREIVCRARTSSFQHPRFGEVWLTFQEDITEEKRADEHRAEMEERARRTQRTHALGVLAGGIAHDFNNVLQGIYLARTDLEDLVEGTPEAAAALETIEELVHRGRGLVRRILTFARPSAENLLNTVNLSELVRSTVALVRPLVGAEVQVEVSILAPDAEVLGRVDQIQQLIVNLATNGALAMKAHGGRLEILLDGVRRDQADWWRLRVRDEGVGIPADTQANIFDPFFTTRPVGEGTGLGLAIVASVAEAHGARISIDSEVGKGTTAEILFPVPGTTTESDERPRIAIVDDEARMVRAYERVLDRRGYQAAVYPSAEAFLESLDGNNIDAVLTDLSMPGFSGMKLASEIRSRRPGLPVILMTGYARPAKDALAAAGVRACLEKPFDMSELMRTLEEVLSAPESRHVG